ncbi:uncharacterized protein LOC135500317 [Lineus longissimus]|uniref:uncharacterized protein LOC135500317 n=1 Tax=Lineus longissimus TaxID=88925 RepID=UPI002B4F51BB
MWLSRYRKMSVQMRELSVVREDSPVIEDLTNKDDDEIKSSPPPSPVQTTSFVETPEGALEIEEEHQEPWRRLLQPPDYILMQNDLPSTSYGLVSGRQRFGITKYSHPTLLKSFDASSDSSSCHYHWCYRPPIGSAGSNVSDDVFSVSPLGGGVKMVQFDDLYADSDSETLTTTKKKRRKSSSKSEDKLGSRDKLHKERARNRKNSTSSETKSRKHSSNSETRSRKHSNSSESRGRLYSTSSETKTRLCSSGSECDQTYRDKKRDIGGAVLSSSSSPSNSENCLYADAKMKRTISVSSVTSKRNSLAMDNNQNSLQRDVKYHEAKKLKLTSKRDEIVLVDTMMGSDDLKHLQEREKSSSKIDGVIFLYAFVTLFCFPLGVAAIVLRIFSRKRREDGNFVKSAKYRKAAKWSAIVGMALSTAIGLAAFMYYVVVPFVITIVTYLYLL